MADSDDAVEVSDLPSAPAAPSARRVVLVRIVAAFVVAVVGGAVAFAFLRNGDDGAGGDGVTPVEGGVLRIALSGVESLDPADASDPAAVMVADMLFDTLVRTDPETGEILPGVAEEWEASFDQRRWTFRLREGVVFHDGSPVTAADVKYTLERIAAPGSDSDYRFLLETVTGYTAFNEEQAAEELTGVRAVDERTLEVELTQPFSLFPAVLANPGFGIVPALQASAERFGDVPVGSGPLKFVERGADVIRLEREPGYQPQPTFLDAVELRLAETGAAAYEMLRRDDVDVAPVPADRVNEARDLYGESGFSPFVGVLFYGMNFEAPEFDDVRMRRAVLAAVDRRRIVDVVYDGTVLLADGFVPEGIPEAVENACADRCDHDLGAARRLVEEAFPGGDVPTVSIDFDDDPVQQAVAASLQADLESVGIPAELRPHDFKDYGVFLVNEEPELFRLGWTGDYLSADGFLFPLFVSEQRDNLTKLQNRQVDQLLRSARAESDPQRRTELYREAEQLVLDQYPVVPIAQFTNRWAATGAVKGLEFTPLGTFDVTSVFLSRPGGARA